VVLRKQEMIIDWVLLKISDANIDAMTTALGFDNQIQRMFEISG